MSADFDVPPHRHMRQRANIREVARVTLSMHFRRHYFPPRRA